MDTVLKTYFCSKKFLKVKASTLVETLVASVIIVIVFSIASLTLQNVLKNTLDNNVQKLDAHLNRVYYLYEHSKIGHDYRDSFNNWEVSIFKEEKNGFEQVTIKAQHRKTDKVVSKMFMHERME
jgi:hypothetical protein